MKAHHQRKPLACPWCGYLEDTLVGLNNDKKPAAGAVVICIECHRLSIMLGAAELRRPTPAEADHYMAMPAVRDQIVISRMAGALALGKRRR